MRKQQQIWQEVHKQNEAFPSYTLPEPSGMVVQFLGYLKSHKVAGLSTAVDIGCGRGRNSVYLAQEGFRVTALDYVQGAIDAAKEAAARAGVGDKISFVQTAIDEHWPLSNETFDVAVDCFSSIDIETKEGREMYRDEMYRTLRPGGYALVCVVSSEDEYEVEMMARSPGAEQHSTYWVDNGKFQKNYDEEELREFYRIFTIVDLQEIKKSAQKMGRAYTATNYWVVLRK